MDENLDIDDYLKTNYQVSDEDLATDTENYDEPTLPDTTKLTVENLLGENFEVLDSLEPNDEVWKTKGFRKQLDVLGPDIMRKPQLAAKVEPFKLEWAFGFSDDTTVINLCHSVNQRILFFNVTQCGVLYDLKLKKMDFLRGHVNKISFISSTCDGKFLATADSGSENIIIIWQRSDISPVRIFFDPYKGKNIVFAEISILGTYLVSVGQDEGSKIKIDFWIWANEKDEPDGTAYMDNFYGEVIRIKFSMVRESFFAILFERAVVFFTWDIENETLSDPILPTMKYKGKLGTFTDMTYIEKCHEAMVSTTEGCIVVFGSTLYYQNFDESRVTNAMMAIKICKITKIPVVTIDSADSVIVTGDSKGIINIFDRRLRLLFWYDVYVGKPIHSIRFDMRARKYLISRLCLNEVVHFSVDGTDSDDDFFGDDSEKYEIIYRDQLRKDASPMKERWVIRNFIVVQNETVNFVDFIKGAHTVIYERGRDHVGAISVHSEFTYLAVGYKNGFIFLYDYMNNFLHINEKLPNALDEEGNPATITCLEYSPKSFNLACGRSNGELWMLDPVTLRARQEFPTISDSAIEKITFSDENTQMAFCNAKTTVYLMIFDKIDLQWNLVGKIRSHYKQIIQILFFKTDPKKLVSLGTDRYLAMYNNVNIEPGDEFVTTVKVRIDQRSVPLACEVYPEKHFTSQYRYLIVVDDQFKYKLVNEATQMCRFVALGPAYGCYEGTPVSKIKLLPGSNDDYMIFMTKKHFGLQKLPVTGNPYTFTGCFGHHRELMDFAVSGDGEFVFTVGKDDTTVLRWRTITRGVDLMVNIGGQDLEPFYCIIQGGKNGYLFQEMQDLYYYMQILGEGEYTKLPRQIGEKLSVQALPDIMRAVGFYPSEFEIETMMVDIKYRDYDKDGTIREWVSFFDFIYLYINHRPVYGYSLVELEDTFQILTESVEEPTPGILKRDDLLEMITQEGEPMHLPQIHKCMQVLYGAADQPDGGHFIFDFMPEDITYKSLIDDVLGVDMNRDTIDLDTIKQDLDYEGTEE